MVVGKKDKLMYYIILNMYIYMCIVDKFMLVVLCMYYFI